MDKFKVKSITKSTFGYFVELTFEDDASKIASFGFELGEHEIKNWLNQIADMAKKKFNKISGLQPTPPVFPADRIETPA